jgi:hypothetical protein
MITATRNAAERKTISDEFGGAPAGRNGVAVAAELLHAEADGFIGFCSGRRGLIDSRLVRSL